MFVRRLTFARAWDLLKLPVYIIMRQFEHVISSESYAQDLQKEVGKLAYEADWVEMAQILTEEEAGNDPRTVYSDVTEWYSRAEKALKEARNLLGKSEKASKTCCYGILPDPSCRYQFSKMAMGKIEDIQILVHEGNEFEDIDDISFSVAPPTSIERREDNVFDSRASIAQEIVGALAKDRINVVGVFGVDGVGKSTLLVDVERRIKEDKSFDWVVAKADLSHKLGVSRKPDIKRIQEEIAYCLGHSNIKNRQTIPGRAKLLRRRLEHEEKNKKKVLIILDELRVRLDLESVGIPCGHDNYVRGCKLLFASRDPGVLRKEMGCYRDFRLDRLKDEEAKGLFRRLAGDKVHNDEFKPWVEEALDKCAGLPFLIVAIAKRFKDADLSEWKETLEKIGKSKSGRLGEVIHNLLQLSYDHLEEEVKSILQLCVVYGGSKPSLENLVKNSVDFGLFREASRESLRSGIRTLKASFLLLEDGEVDDFKIHPLVREFVISTDPRLLLLNDKGKEAMEYLKTRRIY